MSACPPVRLLRAWLLLIGAWCCVSLGAWGAVLPSRAAALVRDIDLWPSVLMLEEAGAPLSLEQVEALSSQFTVPQSPYANLGVRRQPVWLQVPITAPSGESTDWVLDLNYPSIDRVEVYLTRDGRLVQQSLLGDHLAFAQRPMSQRAHDVPLALQAGQTQTLWLRVETSSSMILPLHLMTPERLAEREARTQLLQGATIGAGLCLVLYALAYWFSLREATFLYYALSAAAITGFFVALEGLGPQHLWHDSVWLTRNAAPFMILLALAGGLPFLERTLRVRQLMPRVGQTMNLLAGVALAAMVAFALGWIDYRQAHLTGTLLGPMPILLGLPAAWGRSRQGDRSATYILFGWGIYAIGIVIMALLLRGHLDATPMTLHAFQVSGLVEMAMWMRVLGVRVEDLRREAERTRRERETLHSMAHSDPLTGLLNRRGLQQAIQPMLDMARPERPLGVYVLDLDGFKMVNDRLGHDAGDALLRSVGERLLGCVRASDRVARLGGDEFVVLVADLPSNEEAERIGHKLLATVAEPFHVNGEPARVGMTIGYALGPQDGQDEASLLKRADAAMYGGKQAGKLCVRRGGASSGLA